MSFSPVFASENEQRAFMQAAWIAVNKPGFLKEYAELYNEPELCLDDFLGKNGTSPEKDERMRKVYAFVYEAWKNLSKQERDNLIR
jgi:hypothetical protein